MIGRIKNIWLRRFVLIATAVPLTLAVILLEAWIGILKGLDEAISAINNAWDDRP